MAEVEDIRSHGLGVVIARGSFHIGGPEVISGKPATSRRRDEVGDDGTATHPLSFAGEAFLRWIWKVKSSRFEQKLNRVRVAKSRE